MKQLTKFKLVFIVLVLCMNLLACDNKENAYFKGQYLYIGTEKYVESTGIYKETNTVICRTNNDYIIYEVDGDTEHNYVVARSFLDQKLYVKENYKKEKTTIEGYYFEQNSMKYICEKEFTYIFKKMLDCKEIVELDDESLIAYKREGISVYVRYYNDCVGEYCGSIIFNGIDYMYYNYQEDNTILINEEMMKKLVEFNVLKE